MPHSDFYTLYFTPNEVGRMEALVDILRSKTLNPDGFYTVNVSQADYATWREMCKRCYPLGEAPERLKNPAYMWTFSREQVEIVRTIANRMPVHPTEDLISVGLTDDENDAWDALAQNHFPDRRLKKESGGFREGGVVPIDDEGPEVNGPTFPANLLSDFCDAARRIGETKMNAILMALADPNLDWFEFQANFKAIGVTWQSDDETQHDPHPHRDPAEVDYAKGGSKPFNIDDLPF